MIKELEKIKREYIEEIIEVGKGGIRKENIEMMDYLTHTAKSLCGIIHSFEEEGYSRNYGENHYGEGYGENYGENYGEHYGDGNYSARGRGRNARRDSRGRYASDDEVMREKLRRMSEDAQNDYMRREFQQYGERMR